MPPDQRYTGVLHRYSCKFRDHYSYDQFERLELAYLPLPMIPMTITTRIYSTRARAKLPAFFNLLTTTSVIVCNAPGGYSPAVSRSVIYPRMLTHLNITVYFAPACASYARIKTEGRRDWNDMSLTSKELNADPGQYQDGGKFDQVHADMRRKRFGRTGEGTVPEPAREKWQDMQTLIKHITSIQVQ